MDNNKRNRSEPSRIAFAISILICACVLLVAAQDSAGPGQTTKSSSPSGGDSRQKYSKAADSLDTVTNPGPKVAQRPNPSLHAVTKAALGLGIFSCLKRINQVANVLTANAECGVLISPSKNNPDDHIFSVSYEILTPGNSTIYASSSFFPNNDAVYNTVQYVDKSCKELEKTAFKHLTRKRRLKKNVILLGGAAVRVFLMPAGSGTVVIKKEVIP